tara:strand:+ start:721 stop:1653 length:933 start_codon:yes stop_codon:yes gene_type:complete
MRQISLDLIRVTEAAAIAASEWVGSGEKIQADHAAVKAMRNRLNSLNFSAVIAIGEGKKDKAPGLFDGERVGTLNRDFADYSEYTIAVDPIDGTTEVANGGAGAVSVMAVAKENSLYKTEEHYMMKVAVNKVAKLYFDSVHRKPILSLELPEILTGLSKALNKPKDSLTICVMERPRHEDLIAELRANKCRVKLIRNCDVSASIAACLPDKEIDMYYGIGGAPEAVISAAATKCLGGQFEAKHLDSKEVLCMDRLVTGPCVFVATGITSGMLLEGVHYKDHRKGQPTTSSVFMRSESGTVRWLSTYHNND